MKTKLFVLITITFGLFAFNSKNSKEKFTPPGTVKIDQNLFIDETEITNISWQEYMYWNERIHGKTSSDYLATIPDTTVWEEPYRSHYFNHPAYRDYPVVGVSWQQAKDFCAWRSERVMEQLHIQKERSPKTVVPTKITYRLPSQKEWEQIANAGYLEKTQTKIDKKYSDSAKANFKSENTDITSSTTAPVYQYWPNKYGVYNILGNVAEMTNENGIAKGGSWAQLENEVMVSSNFQYKNPENWVGFRCICEVEF